MSPAQTRQPPGRPAGGQYAAAEHAESLVRLAPFTTAQDRAEYLSALEAAAADLAERTQRALMVDRALRVRALAPNVASFELSGEAGTIRCSAGWDGAGREVGPVARRRVSEAFAGFAPEDFALLLYQGIDVDGAAGWQPGHAA